jgi:hypothetical protein
MTSRDPWDTALAAGSTVGLDHARPVLRSLPSVFVPIVKPRREGLKRLIVSEQRSALGAAAVTTPLAPVHRHPCTGHRGEGRAGARRLRMKHATRPVDRARRRVETAPRSITANGPSPSTGVAHHRFRRDRLPSKASAGDRDGARVDSCVVWTSAAWTAGRRTVVPARSCRERAA